MAISDNILSAGENNRISVARAFKSCKIFACCRLLKCLLNCYRQNASKTKGNKYKAKDHLIRSEWCGTLDKYFYKLNI